MMKKLHYKMYKSGKQWCYAALATVVAGAGIAFASNTALADTGNDQAAPVTAAQTLQANSGTPTSSVSPASSAQEKSSQSAESTAPNSGSTQ